MSKLGGGWAAKGYWRGSWREREEQASSAHGGHSASGTRTGGAQWAYRRAPFINRAVWPPEGPGQIPLLRKAVIWEWVLKPECPCQCSPVLWACSRWFRKDVELVHNLCSRTGALWSLSGDIPEVGTREKGELVVSDRDACVSWGALRISGLTPSDPSPRPWATSVHLLTWAQAYLLTPRTAAAWVNSR